MWEFGGLALIGGEVIRVVVAIFAFEAAMGLVQVPNAAQSDLMLTVPGESSGVGPSEGVLSQGQ